MELSRLAKRLAEKSPSELIRISCIGLFVEGNREPGMKVKPCSLRLVALATLVLSTTAWPLTIESPRPSEQVLPGQTVWLIVQPSSGVETDVRTVQILAPGVSGCENVQPLLPIQCALTIPDGSGESSIPPAVDIRVMVTFANGTEGSASLTLNVANAETLVELRGDPRERPLIFDSVGQEKDITVLGWSTDGATRDLRGQGQGTVYDISNPAVVRVRKDGRVIAQAVGTATITVRNGAFFFEVPVIVRGARKVKP